MRSAGSKHRKHMIHILRVRYVSIILKIIIQILHVIRSYSFPCEKSVWRNVIFNLEKCNFMIGRESKLLNQTVVFPQSFFVAEQQATLRLVFSRLNVDCKPFFNRFSVISATSFTQGYFSTFDSKLIMFFLHCLPRHQKIRTSITNFIQL